MSQYTSWRVGGKVDRLYTPASLEDLAAFLASLDREEPVWFVGLGSNLLVRDGGLRGTVIHLHGTLRNLAIEQRRQNGWTGQDSGKFGVVYAEAGVASPKVARFAASHDLAGAEFLAGIPGTVGGALAMNAGCYGHDTWEFVSQVLTINRAGQINRRGPKDFQVAYRHVAPRDPREEWFVAAWFMFPRGDGSQAREEIKRLLDKRIATQPLELPNAGSVFRNPPGDFAARLIESSGLKGHRVGGAQISEKHANFIVNTGGATAADIEALIHEAKTRVAQKSGVELITEVRIIGEQA
ncbi:MAG TPA: UDP-N-acetylmuramate dehydrogenase [Thiobacillaceae bacterium]|nr:UDP-N-acetylmuramate dehydrogenase [Thiobacillaceae bacterium]HNI08562.1 UDP-N-acetylmuramate dehydrogenase [Thiobacillaceae bacterium]